MKPGYRLTLRFAVLAFAAIVFTTLAYVHAQTAADADFDGDGTVGFADFVAFAGNFGTSSGDGRYDARYDLNGDGNVGFADFVAFAGFSVEAPFPTILQCWNVSATRACPLGFR